VELTARQSRFLARVVSAIEEQPVNTPSELELARTLGTPIQAVEEIVRLGLVRGDLVRLSQSVLYSPAQLEAVRVRLREAFKETPFPPKEARQLLTTTRRYADALLEFFDEEGFLEKTADGRVIRG
jgi:selenocysteine-specific elongation factor